MRKDCARAVLGINHPWMKILAAMIVSSSLTRATAASQPSSDPDLILAHGRLLTLDPHDSVAQAIAIRDGRVVKVGSDAAILELAGAHTRTIDLRGRTATPGLINTHAHVAAGVLGQFIAIELSDATSVVEIVRRVRAKAAQLKPGEWIQGEGWDEAKLAEHRYVLAADLDVAAPKNPVRLQQTTGHYGVANSYALRLANVTADTANPAAGTIERDSGGAPTGVLKESAQELATHLIPPP